MSLDSALMRMMARLDALERLAERRGTSEVPRLPQILLDYNASTDIANPTTLTAGAWTAINTNQSFTIAKATSLIAVSVRGAINCGSTSANARIGSSVVIDSAGTPIRALLGGALANVANVFVNALDGVDVVFLATVAAGTHTIRVEVVASLNSDAYCRASSQASYEGLGIQVLEF